MIRIKIFPDVPSVLQSLLIFLVLQLTILQNYDKLITSRRYPQQRAILMHLHLAKHPEIAETILSRIKDHQYGKRLPSVRMLAAEFSVSTRTIQKAMTSLINSQWVIPNGFRGNWINYQKSSRKKNGAVCVFTNSPCSKKDPLVGELTRLIRESGRHLLLEEAPDQNGFPQAGYRRS